MEKNLMKLVEIAERVRVILMSYFASQKCPASQNIPFKAFYPQKRHKSFMIDKTWPMESACKMWFQ